MDERGSIESPLRRVSAGVHDGITPPLGVYSPYIFAGVSPSTQCDTVVLLSQRGLMFGKAERNRETERERERGGTETGHESRKAEGEHFGLAKICGEFAPSTRYHFSRVKWPVSTNMEQ